MSDIKIMVCCHKPCEVPNSDLYMPIHVGKMISEYDLNMQTDCEVNGTPCENISGYNQFYCEMTSMYWAWKNISRLYPNIEYIGLSHYRRLFNPNHLFSIHRITKGKLKLINKIIFSRPITSTLIDCNKNIKQYDNKRIDKDQNKLIDIIRGNDIVSTKPILYLSSTVESEFHRIGRANINLLKDIVNQKYNNYYSTLDHLLNGNKLYAANMIVLKTSLLDEYCEFVFGCLNEHRKKMVEEGLLLKDTEKVYSRIPGYLAELLTATYVTYKEKNGAKVKHINKYFVC